MINQIFLSACIVLFTTFSFGQFELKIEMPSDKVKVDFTVEQDGCDAVIIANVKIVKHWKINSTTLPADNFGSPTRFDLKPSANYRKVGKIIEPKPIVEFEPKSEETLSYHKGSFQLKQKIKVLSDKDFTITVDFEYQTCDSVKCLAPYNEEAILQIKGCSNPDAAGLDPMEGDEIAEEAIVNEEPSSESDTAFVSKTGQTFDTLSDRVSNKSLWTIFILSFLSGFAALLTPCVFPMIPMTVSFFTKQSKTKSEGIKNASIYGVSIIVIYILLGTLVTNIFGAEALNNMSTNPTFNLIFFLLLVVFAFSFMGAFEIRMPSSWINKADQRADKGGMIGIFFMALALALVSFSCTGPIVGTLLVQSATIGGVAPFVGMFGFSLALALPFTLFAMFPGWLNSLPKSGGWLNTVKVVLGILELALAFKFLSNADLALQLHLLERELFLAIWITIFGFLAMYLFGFVRMPHDSPLEHLSVGRAMLGMATMVFVVYMIPGLWGAPLKIISAFPPPMNYSESPLGFGGAGQHSALENMEDGMHLGPQNILVFHDYDKALAYAKKVNKPLFIDFTGHNCVNCRKMEQTVWGEPGIIDILKNDVVIASLHVDERVKLPESEQVTVTMPDGKTKTLRTVGEKWMYKQITDYKITAQPYYRMQTPDGVEIENGSATYENHRKPEKFQEWLEKGLFLFKRTQGQ